MLTIREAVDADAEALAALAAVTFPLACPPGLPRQDIDEFLRTRLSAEVFAGYIKEDGCTVLLADHDGVPAGYTVLVGGAPADPAVRAYLSHTPAMELSKCYVHPDHHGLGVSRVLMNSTIDWARRSAVGLWLGVNQRNERAIAFYTKSGFQTVGTRSFLVGSVRCEDYVMERAIEAPAAA